MCSLITWFHERFEAKGHAVEFLLVVVFIILLATRGI